MGETTAAAILRRAYAEADAGATAHREQLLLFSEWASLREEMESTLRFTPPPVGPNGEREPLEKPEDCSPVIIHGPLGPIVCRPLNG